MPHLSYFFFFFNDTATTEIYTLSLHDALPIYLGGAGVRRGHHVARRAGARHGHDRRGVRDRVRAGPDDRRTRGPLPRAPRPRAHRRRALPGELRLGEPDPARVTRRRAPPGAAAVRSWAHEPSAAGRAAAAANACVVARAIRVRGGHRGAAVARDAGPGLGRDGARLAV